MLVGLYRRNDDGRFVNPFEKIIHFMIGLMKITIKCLPFWGNIIYINTYMIVLF